MTNEIPSYEMKYDGQSPARLYVPPSSSVQPPVETRTQSLPFNQLSWQDFEKLCFRLIRVNSTVEDCRVYGTPGEAQSGIDILARVKGTDKYTVYQCKNERNFGPAKIQSAVTTFLDGEWREKSDVFVLCTQESMRQTTRAKAITEQAQVLSTHNISFRSWDHEELVYQIKSHPNIVDDFFGRPWVDALCGAEAVEILDNRIDSTQRIQLRKTLLSFYRRVFDLHDRGVPLLDELTLYERYVVSDIELVEALQSSNGQDLSSPRHRGSSSQESSSADTSRWQTRTRLFSHRLPIASWIVRGNRNLLFGEPGVGKSTFLRFLALDLLQNAPQLADTAKKWGDHIPIWLPFALWTKVIHSGGIAERAITATVESFLKSWDAEELVPLVQAAFRDGRALLLLDGLDEYSSLESAKIALNHLHSFLVEHDIPVIATTRPHGFDRLNMNRVDWQTATITGLSEQQQERLSQLWFRAATTRTQPSLQGRALVRHVERQSENFLIELSRSRDLRILAENPLLLCLLISFQISRVRFPVNRFSAHAALTDYLLEIHPERRRIATEIVGSHDLPHEDVKRLLAYLAFTIHENHSDGLISEVDAINTVKHYALDDDDGLGIRRYEASTTAVNLIERATNYLGILARRSQDELGFVHRSIQEYLVSYYLSRLTLDIQTLIVAAYCNDALWREPILGLLQITARPADVKTLVNAISQITPSKIDSQARAELLAEVAFGSFNCPPRLAKILASEVLEEIENGTWLPHRERLLKHALDGLGSPSTSHMVKEKLPVWYQDRCGWSVIGIFEAMSGWNPDSDVIETLFVGLTREDYEAKRAAGLSLAEICNGNDTIGKRLEVIAKVSEDPRTVAVAVEGLLKGWSAYPSVRHLVERCRESDVPELRIMGIRGRVDFGEHDDDDLRDLLRLADRHARRYWLRDQAGGLLMAGWPGDRRVKEVCLDSARCIHGSSWHGHGEDIERDIALWVLLEGYSMDEEVVSFLAEYIRTESHPFFTLYRRNAFRLLAKNFRDAPAIVSVLDEWIAEQDVTAMGMEVSLAARVGRTAAFKKCLLQILSRPYPHWSAEALLEIWGISDPAVNAAFDNIIADIPRASMIAHLLPQVLTDPKECRRYLLNLIRDPQCRRPDFALKGLVFLGASGTDEEVIDVALSLIVPTKESRHHDGIRQTLYLHFLDNARVRQIAMESLNGSNRDHTFVSVAQACGSDIELRSLLLRLVTPLPTRLRQVIASHMAHADVDDELAVTLLTDYDLETDPEVKVSSAIGYYSRLELTEKNRERAAEDLTKRIACVGPDYMERRLAAFCGLVLIDRLDVLSANNGAEEVGIMMVKGFNVNIPAVRFVLKYWTELRAHFGERFWQTIFGGSLDQHAWDVLAQFADEYLSPSREALEFYREQETKTAGTNGLQFIARVWPRSPLLLDYCVTTLGFRQVPKSEDRSSTVNRSDWPDSDLATAAEIIGQHFGEDSDLPHRIHKERNRFQFDELVLVLSEGWPHSQELERCLEEMAATRAMVWESTVFRCLCIQAPSVRIYKELRRWIRSWSSWPRYRQYGMFVRPTVVRLQQDKKLREMLLRHLSSIGTSSEKVSFCQLLGKAVGLSTELEQWAEAELGKQSGLDGKEYGYDIMTGESLSVSHAIYKLLQPSSS